MNVACRWDKYNNSLVIEASPNNTMVYENPVGVLTNNPLFPQQLQVRCNAVRGVGGRYLHRRRHRSMDEQ